MNTFIIYGILAVLVSLKERFQHAKLIEMCNFHQGHWLYGLLGIIY